MGAINTAAYLASIRSKMDAQQQVVALLENELQKSILGDKSTTFKDLLAKPTPEVKDGGTVKTAATAGGSIYAIYNNIGLATTDSYGFNPGNAWINAMSNAATVGSGSSSVEVIDQEALRQMLYQARALLGELRIEEQAWNGEVNSEKTLRKEVNDFAKI